MKIPISIIKILKDKSSQLKHPSYLFSFDYNKLNFRCIYLATNYTLLITTRSSNSIAWTTCIDTDSGYIDTFIPNDCFKEIASYVVENKKVEGFFAKIQEKLYESSNDKNITTSSNSEIIDIMKICKTTDKYVYEGDRPFYDHFRRVNPSNDNLKKIKRIMGFDMYKFCIGNSITIVWNDSPKDNSLDYLHPEKLQKSILSDIDK
ncbi:MAG: hypothetical protein LBQ34_07185 [Alphaproteobacteria bacterium]|jgi:hypothetical protein|nr:hypothetical protein [Alphaproteobacteria bacterium]